MSKMIEVPKRKLKGEDGYHTFSIRVPDDLYLELECFTKKNGTFPEPSDYHSFERSAEDCPD